MRISRLFPLFLLACTHDPNGSADPPVPEPARPPPSPVGEGTPVPGSPASGPIHVSGRLRNEADAPIAARLLTFVDAAGKRTDIPTAADGTFSLDVMAPYDLSVPDEFGTYRQMLLGLTRPELPLQIYGSGSNVTLPAPAKIQIDAYTVACPAQPCLYQVATSSSGGSGAEVWTSAPGITAKRFVITHRFYEAVPGPQQIRIDMLVSAADMSKYWYTRATVSAGPDDVVTQLVTPSDVPLLGKVIVRAHDDGVPPTWSRYVYGTMFVAPSYFRLGNSTEGTSIDARFPAIPGAKLTVGVSAHAPDNGTDENWHTEGSQDVAAQVTDQSVVLDERFDLESDSPKMNESVPASIPTLRWKRTQPSLAQALLRCDGLRATVRVHTVEPKLDLARLDRLGFEKLVPGKCLLRVTADRTATSVDESAPLQALTATKATTSYADHSIEFTVGP